MKNPKKAKYLPVFFKKDKLILILFAIVLYSSFETGMGTSITQQSSINSIWFLINLFRICFIMWSVSLRGAKRTKQLTRYAGVNQLLKKLKHITIKVFIPYKWRRKIWHKKTHSLSYTKWMCSIMFTLIIDESHLILSDFGRKLSTCSYKVLRNNRGHLILTIHALCVPLISEDVSDFMGYLKAKCTHDVLTNT